MEKQEKCTTIRVEQKPKFASSVKRKKMQTAEMKNTTGGRRMSFDPPPAVPENKR